MIAVRLSSLDGAGLGGQDGEAGPDGQSPGSTWGALFSSAHNSRPRGGPALLSWSVSVAESHPVTLSPTCQEWVCPPSCSRGVALCGHRAALSGARTSTEVYPSRLALSGPLKSLPIHSDTLLGHPCARHSVHSRNPALMEPVFQWRTRSQPTSSGHEAVGRSGHGRTRGILGSRPRS